MMKLVITCAIALLLSANQAAAADLAYVTNADSNTVSVIARSTNTVVATVPVGGDPNGVAITPDGAFAYVANRAAESVSVIDTSTNMEVATLAVGFGPIGVAIAGPAPVNAAPTAVAGADQSIHAGTTVYLDGGASSDDNTASANLVYAWSFSLQPPFSTSTLVADPTDPGNPAKVSFLADVAGTYELTLEVTDDGAPALSGTATVSISSDNLAPTANAGDDQLVILGNPVNLNGLGSTDPENETLGFAWTMISEPAGSTASVDPATNPTPSFTPNVEGVYTVQLEVSDAIGPGTLDTVEITATTATGVAEQKILSASDLASSLTAAQVTTSGNQNAFSKFLSQATAAIQKGQTATAVNKLNDAIERTDGCETNGTPDGNGPGRDWITDCNSQAQVLGLLRAALDAVTP